MSGRVLSTGTSIPVELECTSLLAGGCSHHLRNSESPCPRVFVELNLATQKVPRVFGALCQKPEIRYLFVITLHHPNLPNSDL